MDPATYMMIALLVVAGMAAVGVVLGLKVTRRRQAAERPHQGKLDTGVPAKPMSREHAERLQRRYIWSATAVLVLLGVLGVIALT